MASHDIAKVLEYYGARVPHRGGYTKVRCPFHQDTQPSATVHRDKQRFHCFVCNFDGDAIAVVRWQEGCGYADALRKTEEITGEGNSQVRDGTGDSEWISAKQGDTATRRREVEAWRLY